MTNASEQMSPEQKAIANVGVALAMVVDDALRPALLPYPREQWARNETSHDGYVRACPHVPLGDVDRESIRNASPVQTDRNAYLCPMHPHRLLCDVGTCIADHLQDEHWRDPRWPLCFVCEQPVRDDFVPVFAEITLHQNVNVSYEMLPDTGIHSLHRAYGGVLLTLPVTYLCAEHGDLVDVPIRMGWPMGEG